MGPLAGGLILSGVSALINGGAALYSKKKSTEAYEEYLKSAKAERDAAQAKADYYENINPLETRQGRAMAEEARQAAQEINNAAAGREAVLGTNGTGIAAAQAKDKTAKMLADSYKNILLTNDAINGRKAAAWQQAANSYGGQLSQNKYQQSVNNANAAASALNGLGQSLGMMGYAFIGSGNGAGSGNGTEAGGVTERNQNGGVIPG